MTSILFGSISTIADTSELQRDAYNRAFQTHGLDWDWSQQEYADLLRSSGGADRVADYAAARGVDVDADAVHQTKSELFQQSLSTAQVQARPGVVETVKAAKQDGLQVALVTTTSPENVSALLQALSPQLQADDFDLIVDTSQVDDVKPDPAAYAYALEELGVDATDSVAIEDNLGGVDAAVAAGVACVAFPNANTAAHDFDAAAARVDELSLAELTRLAGAA